MTILSRNEQENIALQFEREYGSLVMSRNCGLYKENEFNKIAERISSDIRNVAHKRYFEDDILSHLGFLADSIDANINISYQDYNKKAFA